MPGRAPSTLRHREVRRAGTQGVRTPGYAREAATDPDAVRHGSGRRARHPGRTSLAPRRLGLARRSSLLLAAPAAPASKAALLVQIRALGVSRNARPSPLSRPCRRPGARAPADWTDVAGQAASAMTGVVTLAVVRQSQPGGRRGGRRGGRSGVAPPLRARVAAPERWKTPIGVPVTAARSSGHLVSQVVGKTITDEVPADALSDPLEGGCAGRVRRGCAPPLSRARNHGCRPG
jgi:hypothetical protein